MNNRIALSLLAVVSCLHATASDTSKLQAMQEPCKKAAQPGYIKEFVKGLTAGAAGSVAGQLMPQFNEFPVANQCIKPSNVTQNSHIDGANLTLGGVRFLHQMVGGIQLGAGLLASSVIGGQVTKTRTVGAVVGYTIAKVLWIYHAMSYKRVADIDPFIQLNLKTSEPQKQA